MRHIKLAVAAIALLIACPTFAQSPAGSGAKIMSAAPADSVTVMGLYKQTVYDPFDNKIGQITDMLVDPDGKLSAFVVGAGGFLGLAKHDVLVPISAIRVAKKNGKEYLVMDTTKKDLKNAQAFRYDPVAMTWTPDDSNKAGARSSEANRNKVRK